MLEQFPELQDEEVVKLRSALFSLSLSDESRKSLSSVLERILDDRQAMRKELANVVEVLEGLGDDMGEPSTTTVLLLIKEIRTRWRF